MKKLKIHCVDTKVIPTILPLANEKPHHFYSAFAAPVAGIFTLCVVYPLDTLRTRLQAAKGFERSGGYCGLYRGFTIMAIGTIPTTSILYATFETSKSICEPLVSPEYYPLVHMFGAIFARLLSSVVRVPIEVAKQRKQVACRKAKSSYGILIEAYRNEGLCRGVYRGFASTMMRDIPFSFIELPAWEILKGAVKLRSNGQITSAQSAVCGALAGAVGAIITNPFDLAKTRIMLTKKNRRASYDQLRVKIVLSEIYAENGIQGLFKGVVPRTLMVMLGSFIFYGFYEETRYIMANYVDTW